MIEVPIPVKDHLLDAFLDAFLRDQFPDLLRRIHVPWAFEFPSKLWTQRGGTGQGLALGIDDRLDVDMLQASKDIKTWPFEASLDTAPHSSLPFQSA